VRLLLDTHILLWWLDDDPRLAVTLRKAILDGTNEILVSSITVAEIEIKKALGKLDVPRELLALLDEAGFRTLPLSAVHAQQLRDLPPHHADPFDRMLVAQAIVEGVPLATADARLAAYDLELVPN
jgi:PIN domain nuclease of toxin-antitoxin system